MRAIVEKKNISYHWNQVVIHKKLGKVLVKEITSSEEGKFVGEILSTNETKKFVFSSQFFEIGFDDTSYDVKVNTLYKPQRKKERNYAKYRNHPLVKDIEYKENRIRKAREVAETTDDDDSTEDDD